MFFYWLLERGKDFALAILASTLQLAGDANGMQGVDWGAFANIGVKIFMEVIRHISVWQPVVAFAASAIAILMLIVLGLITVNLILVNCETWIMLSAGLIFLGFGASEWTRDLSVSYFKHLLGVGIKQFVTLLLASIGLNIMNSLYAAAQQTGWGADVGGLATALVDTFILLIVIGSPGCCSLHLWSIRRWDGGVRNEHALCRGRYGSASGSCTFGGWGRSYGRGPSPGKCGAQCRQTRAGALKRQSVKNNNLWAA
jgi:P-type conjugative transfer protein TrbL